MRIRRAMPKHEAEKLLKELEGTHRTLCGYMADVPISSPIYVALEAGTSALVVTIKAARREADKPEMPANKY